MAADAAKVEEEASLVEACFLLAWLRGFEELRARLQPLVVRVMQAAFPGDGARGWLSMCKQCVGAEMRPKITNESNFDAYLLCEVVKQHFDKFVPPGLELAAQERVQRAVTATALRRHQNAHGGLGERFRCASGPVTCALVRPFRGSFGAERRRGRG